MDVFVARQPIFDKDLKVFAYELLYRGDNENFYASPDPDKATYDVITSSLLLIGIESLTGGKRAFINFTGNLLLDEVTTVLPKQLIAVEILENVEPNEQIIDACRKLKDLGYLIVLDDFIYNPKLFNPMFALFIELADIIKVDFLNSTFDERRKILKWFDRSKVKFLAEKVETREDFEQAVELGYEYFQGYFFSKPVIAKGRDVPSYKLTYMQIIREVNQPNPDFDQIGEIIERDVSMSYKLLQYINSVAFGFKTSINSIKHAVVMLGMVELQKWISLVALRGIGEDKPDEIMRSSVIRAKFGELLASKIGFPQLANEFFLIGLFSMIDALIDRPMSQIMSELPVPEGIKMALLDEPGLHKNVYLLITSYEKGDWEEFNEAAAMLNINTEEVPKIFLETLDWTERLFSIKTDEQEMTITA